MDYKRNGKPTMENPSSPPPPKKPKTIRKNTSARQKKVLLQLKGCDTIKEVQGRLKTLSTLLFGVEKFVDENF